MGGVRRHTPSSFAISSVFGFFKPCCDSCVLACNRWSGFVKFGRSRLSLVNTAPDFAQAGRPVTEASQSNAEDRHSCRRSHTKLSVQPTEFHQSVDHHHCASFVAIFFLCTRSHTQVQSGTRRGRVFCALAPLGAGPGVACRIPRHRNSRRCVFGLWTAPRSPKFG